MAKLTHTRIARDIASLTFVLQAVVLSINPNSNPIDPVLVLVCKITELRGLHYIDTLTNTLVGMSDINMIKQRLMVEVGLVLESNISEEERELIKTTLTPEDTNTLNENENEITQVVTEEA